MEARARRRTGQNAARAVPDDGGGAAANVNRARFLEKVRTSSEAVQNGDYAHAVQLYTEALALDPANHILYTNRAAAYAKLRQYKKAAKDAKRAQELNPKWIKAYYREGVALQCLGKDADAMAAYASGLVQEPKNMQLLDALVTTAMQSALKDKFVPIYAQLKKMKLDLSSFVVISVLGQELLTSGCFAASLVLLESALRIGTCSLKLRGSVFSALSSAHWGLGSINKAIACMQQDLAITKSLGDQEGECRSHGNLGSAYFSKGNYLEALQHHRAQLVLATQLKERTAAISALSSLGHVYTAIGDYPNGLSSHKQCVLLVKQGKDKLQEAREIGNVGSVYLAMGDFDSALQCHTEHLKMAKQIGNKVEEARAFSNLGSAYHYKRDYEKAILHHNQVLNLSMSLGDRTLEARAYAGLGHASRCKQDYAQAKHFHEKQLDNALQTKDRVAEGRSCSNLGIIYQQLGDYDAALKLHKAHLQVAKDIGDRASQGRAYGNIGNAHSSLGQYDLAIRFHKQELAISKEVSDRHSEMSTHGNLAVAYQALGISDKAIHHYNLHLKMSRELKDSSSETRALSNLGNYYSSLKDYPQAITFYEQCLILSQENEDVEGEGKACHKLGYAHYCLGNYREAIRYYEQDLALAKDLQDKTSMCRAYCNLGLAHKALVDYPKALECQKYFLATAHMTKNVSAKFCALGNIGDVLIKLSQLEEAAKMFSQQHQLAKQGRDRKLEATACGNLGNVHRELKHFDKALGYHNQELTMFQEVNDLKGECKAHSSLGNVHMALGNYTNAYRCYEEELDRGRDLKDSSVEAHAYGNLGITRVNMNQFEDAIGLFEQQLAMLEQSSGHKANVLRGRAYGNLGDCYDALGDYEEAAKCYEQFLVMSQDAGNTSDQIRAYRGLGSAHRSMGNLQQALVCFEKRLVVAHEMDKSEAKSSAYAELGALHGLLGNFEQAISCLQHQLRFAREVGDRVREAQAASGLGGVYQEMGEEEKALEYHQMDLEIAEQSNNPQAQCRAYGNLGLSHESLGNYEQAISFQQQHLKAASRLNDTVAHTHALSCLGRIHHAMGDYPEAIQYLQQGLRLAEVHGQREHEAKIRHGLGLALLVHGDLEDAQLHLQAAVELFENIRREAHSNSEYKLSLFDLQTASYQALQRVLVGLGRHDEALVVAERGRTRAFVDLLLERQHLAEDEWSESMDSTPVTKDQIVETVDRQKAAVLYFSQAAGYLYSWLILPDQGVVKFHESSVAEFETGSDPEDTQSLRSIRSLNVSTASLLDVYVGQARESLGIESHLSASRLSLNRSSFIMSETESEADDLWQQHLEEIGDRLNAENDRTGFLRMVNRNHIWNASTHSIGSILSLSSSSPGGLLGNRNASTRASRLSLASNNSGKPPLGALYDLLIAPMEDVLRNGISSTCKDLVLILQGDLYLVPFALLKEKQAMPALFERFNLIVMPSLRALQDSQTQAMNTRYNPDCTGAVIVGNPKIPQAVFNQWQWGPLPGAEQECKMVSEIMGSHSMTGPNATKDVVIQQMRLAESIHFATHVSWKLSALVLSPGDFSTTQAMHGNMERMDLNSSSDNLDASFEGPPLSDFLLTAADLLNTKLSAKLVVISSGHTDDRAGRINSDGVVGLTRALLAAGVQCVLFCLWPIPEMAGRILLKAFYTSLLQGARASQALTQGMKTVQNTRQFVHPSNWAGWILVGSDIKLSSKVALMGHALCQMLKTPSMSREAMRVCLHLVEKSLQRIRNGQCNAMYTTQQSIENKVGNVSGWRDLLVSVGFQFEPDTNGLPASVFFPTSDPGERLTQCSASLQSLLGLPLPTLQALTKILEQPEAGEALSSLLQQGNTPITQESGIQLAVGVRLWRVGGIHEFLASLGFDLVEVGKDEVTIRAGKQANRRTLQFARQALVAVFETHEAPRTLLLDSSSSMESLASSSSATSTSNFSKGSTPPTSPTSRKRSYFNPAEVAKLPTIPGRNQQNIKGKGNHSPTSSISIHLSHQDAIRRKYSSPSASDASDTNAPDDMPRIYGTDLDTPVTGTKRLPSRQSLFDRVGGTQEFFPRPQYSTSDSEDAHIPENTLSKSLSQSRTSLLSQSSTLTAKSTGSNGGFRRTRARSSVASTRSSASDRTITNESRSASLENMLDADDKRQPEEFSLSRNSMESLVSTRSNDSRKRDHRLDGRHKKSHHFEKSSRGRSNSFETSSNHSKDSASIKSSASTERRPERTEHRFSHRTESDSSLTSTTSGEHGLRTSAAAKAIDPTAVAQRVLAETKLERRALEEMQRWSAQNMEQELMGKRAEVIESVMNAGSMNTQQDEDETHVAEDTYTAQHILPEEPANPSHLNNTTTTTATVHHSATGPPTKPKPQLKPKPKPKPILANSFKDQATPSQVVNSNILFTEPPQRLLDFDETASMLSAINEESDVSVTASRSPSVITSDTDGDASFKPRQVLAPVCEGVRGQLKDGGITSLNSKVKSVTFQEEVELVELYSSMENVNSEASTPRPLDPREGSGVAVAETDFTGTQQDLHEHNGNRHSQPCPSQNIAPRSFMSPTGYKAPPPYPGPSRSQRQGSLDSTASSEHSIHAASPPVVQNGHKPGDSAGSSSEHDSWDWNSPQSLQKASMQFYRSPAGGRGIGVKSGTTSAFSPQNFRSKKQPYSSPTLSQPSPAYPQSQSQNQNHINQTHLGYKGSSVPVPHQGYNNLPPASNYTPGHGLMNGRGSYSDNSVHSMSGSDSNKEQGPEGSSEREWYQSDSEDQENIHAKLDSSWTSVDSDIIRMEQNLRRNQGYPGYPGYPPPEGSHPSQPAPANQNNYPGQLKQDSEVLIPPALHPELQAKDTPQRTAGSPSWYVDSSPATPAKDPKVLYKGVVMYTSDC